MNPLSVVRSDALLDPELQKSPAVYMTLAAIATFTTRSKDGYCYFKQETIANHLGKSRQAVSRDINKLAELGYVEVISQTYRGFKSNNAYRIRYEGSVNTDATSRCNDATSRCTTTQRDVAAKCSSINAKKEKEALTREIFRKKVDQAFKDGEFSEFKFTLDGLMYEVGAAYDHWEGYDRFPEGDIIAAFRGWLRKASNEAELKTLVTKRKERKGVSVDAGSSNWRLKVKNWKESKFWYPSWGEAPDHPNTRVPVEILNEFNINQNHKECEYA